MNLPMQPLIERRYAHFAEPRPRGLLPQISACQGQGVMVAHVRARGASLIRYPSPAGRGGCPQGRRPCFFIATVGEGKGQGNSTKRRIVPNSCGMTAAKTAAKKTIRGKELCKRSQNGLLPSVRPHCLADAETLSPSKPFSAAVPGLRRHMSQRATCSQARLLARLAMSPIARHTRRAADLTNATSLSASQTATLNRATSKHTCFGVAFSLPITTGGQPANATTKGSSHV